MIRYRCWTVTLAQFKIGVFFEVPYLRFDKTQLVTCQPTSRTLSSEVDVHGYNSGQEARDTPGIQGDPGKLDIEWTET